MAANADVRHTVYFHAANKTFGEMQPSFFLFFKHFHEPHLNGTMFVCFFFSKGCRGYNPFLCLERDFFFLLLAAARQDGLGLDNGAFIHCNKGTVQQRGPTMLFLSPDRFAPLRRQQRGLATGKCF